VAKVAQSTTAKAIHVSKIVGSETFLNKKKFAGMFLNFFFYKDENQNAPKLQGQNAYLSHINFKKEQ